MAVLAEFYRSGPAYLLDNGALMADGVPRFEPGKFAGTRALRMEEGTTNILTANQSNVETDGTGFSAFNSPTSGARSTTFAFEGAASFKTVHSATAGSGYSVSVSTSTQATYIGRLRMRGDTAISYSAGSFTYTLRVTYTDASNDQVSATATPDDVTWQDLVTLPVTSNAGKTVSTVTLYALSTGSALSGKATYVDALQIERQTEATTWHVGGGTRNGARCLVPTSRIFDPAAGTVEAWVRVSAVTESHMIFDTRQVGDSLSSTNRCFLRTNGPAGDLSLRYWQGSSLTDVIGGSITPGQWTHVAASWGIGGGTLYVAGTAVATLASIPVLIQSPRLALGGRVDGAETSSGLLLGGMRFTRGRARTGTEILAAYNSNAQFVEDGTDTTVFSFNGTMRSLLPARMVQVAPEPSFLVPTTVTASTSATDYPASNSADWEFPLRSHRTTSTAQATLTFDFAAVVNFRACFVALANWEGGNLATSYDGVTYVDVTVSPFACDVDVDQYRKWGGEINASGRYARVTIPAQAIDAVAPYFETPLIVFADDLDALTANPNWGMQVSLEHEYESGNAGGHDEVQARGKQYVKMQVRAQAVRGQSTEWQHLMALGNHQKFLLFANLGNPAESYLMRSDGAVQWEEQAGYNAISMTWREHIN